jgi:predicted MFS family arabinose efflux permease
MAFFNFSQSLIDSTFNNFLNETFKLTNFERGILEVPRELPGLLAIFISAMFFFLCNRRLASLGIFFASAGVLLVGLFSYNYSMMLFWLFILSVGQHIFLPLTSGIGMELAEDGKTGKRLGQLTGVGNVFAIAGSFVIFMGFNYLNFDFKITYVIAAAGFLTASVFVFFMKKNVPQPIKHKFRLRKEYGLYYWLCILFGTRKQIFMTFAPWVLVTVFHQKVQVVATLLTIGGIIGIFFKPVLGRAIDKFGEKNILAGEALILIAVCVFYGFSKNIFSETVALFVTYGCYIMDQLLMSVSMARATYLQKIAVDKSEISQTLTMGVTLDHAFSILIAVFGGLIWLNFGYQYVFLLGGIIALLNFFSVRRIKTS